MSLTWDPRFMQLALQARSWVKGPDLGVGACVVSMDRRGLSLGFSGLPRGMRDEELRITTPEFKDHHMVHAELNAILNAGRSVSGWTLYATACPCSHCAAAAIQAGIMRVVSPPPDRTSRWHQAQLEGREALRECGIAVADFDMEDMRCVY